MMQHHYDSTAPPSSPPPLVHRTKSSSKDLYQHQHLQHQHELPDEREYQCAFMSGSARDLQHQDESGVDATAQHGFATGNGGSSDGRAASPGFGGRFQQASSSSASATAASSSRGNGEGTSRSQKERKKTIR